MVVGFGVSIAYVLIANLLDTTIKTAEDVEKQMDITVLASIPVLKDDTRKMKGGVL